MACRACIQMWSERLQTGRVIQVREKEKGWYCYQPFDKLFNVSIESITNACT